MKRLVLAFLFVCTNSVASNCPELYPDSKPIVVKNTVELCNSFYVSVFDNVNKRVILVSEHLQHNAGSFIGSVKRTDDFHIDPRIGNVPNPKQYVDTGFDKGHMAPAGDASNTDQMHETFLMTNMTPQNPQINRGVWKILEELTRSKFIKSKKDMYIVNVAIYENDNKMNGIPIPTGYWKIVFVDGNSFYFYVNNRNDAKVVQKQAVDIQTLLPK